MHGGTRTCPNQSVPSNSKTVIHNFFTSFSCYGKKTDTWKKFHMIPVCQEIQLPFYAFLQAPSCFRAEVSHYVSSGNLANETDYHVIISTKYLYSQDLFHGYRSSSIWPFGPTVRLPIFEVFSAMDVYRTCQNSRLTAFRSHSIFT